MDYYRKKQRGPQLTKNFKCICMQMLDYSFFQTYKIVYSILELFFFPIIYFLLLQLLICFMISSLPTPPPPPHNCDGVVAICSCLWKMKEQVRHVANYLFWLVNVVHAYACNKSLCCGFVSVCSWNCSAVLIFNGLCLCLWMLEASSLPFFSYSFMLHLDEII